MRVLIAGGGTGGHLMPALALAGALTAARDDLEPVIVGSVRGIDGRILPQRPYRHHLLPVEPLYRRQWWRNAKWPWLARRLLRDCRRILEQEQPAFALGTGGYVAGPVLYQAHRMAVPFALQEQNAYPGLTTRLLARWAKQIHLGFPEAAAALRPSASAEVFAFGNPIVPPPEPRPDRAAARRTLQLPPGLPVLFVTGGSQGALALNEVIAGCLRTGALEDTVLLWSTGPTHFDRYRAFDAPPRRQLRPFWDPIAEAYAVADLAVARAGGTTAELCAWGIPAVLVPLPTAAAHHQQRNAEALAAAGAAVHVPQSELTPEVLAGVIRDLFSAPENLADMARAAAARGQPNAARRTAERLLAMVG